MICEFLIPGLLLAPEQVRRALAHSEPTPLRHLLGKGHCLWQAPATLESALADLFSQDAPPHAALRLLGERQNTPGPDHYLCADPVQLSFTQQGLILADATALALEMDEARHIIRDLNQEFADLGQFLCTSPERWYLRLSSPCQIGSHRLDEVVGRRVDRFLPDGPQGRQWRAHFNEIQVFLHKHPVNQAREAQGRPQVNSVWFWGEGALAQPIPDAGFQQVLADTPLALGYAQAAGLAHQPLSTGWAGVPGRQTLIVDERLRQAALQSDLEAWRDGLEALTAAWLNPALLALRRGTIRAIRLSLPGDRGSLAVHIQGRDLWRFWRSSQSLVGLEPPISF